MIRRTQLSANPKAYPGFGHVEQIIADLRAGGKTHPPLIAVQGPDESLILIEGHSRATAYAIVGTPITIELFVGSSSSIPSWNFY